MKKIIGLIGIGKMGNAMTKRLQENMEYSIIVWNRSNSATFRLASERGGVSIASSIFELIGDAKNIILNLADDTAIKEVFEQIKSALDKHIASGKLSEHELKEKCIIDCSSTCPRLTHRLAQELKAQYGITWIDAPVSGGPLSAMQGNLAMMVGTDQIEFKRVTEILHQLAKQPHYIGGPGSGQKAKLCNQIILSCFFLILAETVRFAQALTKNTVNLAERLNQGYAKSKFIATFSPRMIDRKYHPALGSVSILLKSLDHIDSIIMNHHDLPLTQKMRNFFHKLVKNGYGESEPSLFVDFFSSLHDGVELVHHDSKIACLELEPKYLDSLCHDMIVSGLILAIAEAMKFAKICHIQFNLAEVFKDGFSDSALLQLLFKPSQDRRTGSTLSTVDELREGLKQVRNLAQQANLSQPFFKYVEDYYQMPAIKSRGSQNLLELVDFLAQSSKSSYNFLQMWKPSATFKAKKSSALSYPALSSKL
jgi:3-hydroxyisobutyrate dehydrogenase-like beta-hydroxyacid dehydrogenase